MFGLPASTAFDKRIPKQKFYDKLTVSTALKKVFIEQIKAIYWRNKIATSTTNLAPGSAVTELEVFEVNLNSQSLDDSFLRQIDREIPYHILFILEYEGKYKAVIGYKEATAAGSNAFKVEHYYHTEWLPEADLHLSIEGLNIDAVYENLVRQIAGDNLRTDSGETLKQVIDCDEKRKQIEKQIAKLVSKLRQEKQLNKQMELNGQLKKLKKELEEIL